MENKGCLQHLNKWTSFHMINRTQKCEIRVNLGKVLHTQGIQTFSDSLQNSCLRQTKLVNMCSITEVISFRNKKHCIHLFRLNVYQTLGYKFSQEKNLLWLSPLSLFPHLVSNQLVWFEFPHVRVTTPFIS